MASPPSLSLSLSLSPPGNSDNSKKRVFTEISPTVDCSSKSRSIDPELIHHELKIVDMEEDSRDAMLIDGNVGSSGKGKGIWIDPSHGHGSENLERVDGVQSLKESFPSEPDGQIVEDDDGSDLSYGDDGSDLSYGDDELMDMYFDDPVHDEYDDLQSHFDNMDIPPGVEVAVSWIPSEAKMDSTTTSTLSPSEALSSPQEMDSANWKQDALKSATTTGSSSTCAGSASSEEQRVDLGEMLRKFRLFKKFDTVEDHSDHHYSRHASFNSQLSKGFAKKIQEEWKILEKDLPDTIFVRVYETRMDLLRAVIMGAEGTPYHDGLYFFDVFFPSEYPKVPPLVHYHSFGLRINPNLYACGKVCLSLLNTWSGQQKEQWIPNVSTMLQVLVSIQGLILNTKPYFNEPGYSRTSRSAMGQQSSLLYNESTYILNLKTMMYCMRRPPKHFEEFVVGHFFQSAQDILLACKSYIGGAQVGSLVRGCVLDAGEGQETDKSCSQSFQTSLAGFIQTLVDTFTKLGAKGCDKFLYLAQPPTGGAPVPRGSNSSGS